MPSRPPPDPRGITLNDEASEQMELVDRTGKPVEAAQSPSDARPAPPRRRSRPLGPEEQRRLETLQRNQEQSTRLLDAVRALLREKGYLA